MENQPIIIDQGLCTQCGICGKVCPRHIPETIEMGGKKQTRVCPERADICIYCGHCASVCAKSAITVDGIPAEGWLPPPVVDVTEDQLTRLFLHRRSVRRYREKPVPREVLQKIARASLLAPSATGRTTRGVLIVDDPSKLKEMMEFEYRTYEFLMAALKNPIARLLIKKKVGARLLHTLTDFLAPALKWYIKWHREGGGDELRRDAPVVMLFHGAVLEPSIDETCMISVTYAVMMAEVLGVGTLVNGILPSACNQNKALKKFLGLPEDHEVFISLSMGYPKYEFKRLIPRFGGTVRFLE